MSYVVTGAGGHLGNWVVRRLISEGRQVTALVFSKRDEGALNGLPCSIERVDVCDAAQPMKVINPGDTVIHCAGVVSISGKDKTVRKVNVEGTKNIIAACRERGAAKLVYVSSVHAILEKPEGMVITETLGFDPELVRGYYAKTKAEATAAVLAATDLDVTVVHPSGIIGPCDSGRGHITQMITDYINGRLPACVRGGYDFVDVRDVAGGVVAAADKGKRGQTYILSGAYSTIADMLSLLHGMYPATKRLKCLPMWLAKSAAPMFEASSRLSKRPPLYTGYSLYTLSSNALFSHEKAALELGYTVRSLKETLEDTVSWLFEAGRCASVGASAHQCT